MCTVLYSGTVNYGGTAIINVYVIVSEFVIHGAFYYVIVSEFGTHGTEYKFIMWKLQVKDVYFHIRQYTYQDSWY